MASRARKGEVLARLNPIESASVLHSLLERHPELVAEVEEIARAALIDVDVDAVARAVEHDVLVLGLDDLGARAGRKSWGYVEPTEAAWELLQEAVDNPPRNPSEKDRRDEDIRVEDYPHCEVRTFATARFTSEGFMPALRAAPRA